MMLAKIFVLIIETLVIGLLAARLGSSGASVIRMFVLAILCFIIGYVVLNGIERFGGELVSHAAAAPRTPAVSPLR